MVCRSICELSIFSRNILRQKVTRIYSSTGRLQFELSGFWVKPFTKDSPNINAGPMHELSVKPRVFFAVSELQVSNYLSCHPRWKTLRSSFGYILRNGLVIHSSPEERRRTITSQYTLLKQDFLNTLYNTTVLPCKKKALLEVSWSTARV